MEEFKDILIVEGINAKGFGIIPKIVIVDRRLSRDAKAIYAYFRSFAGAGGSAFPSVRKICYDLCFGSEDTYRKHFKQLVKYDYIRVKKQRGTDGRFARNIYIVVENPNPEADPQDLGEGKSTVTQNHGDGKIRSPLNWGTNNNNIYNINNKYNNISQSYSNKSNKYSEKIEFVKEKNKKIENIDRLTEKEKFDEKFYKDILKQIDLESLESLEKEDKELINSSLVYLLSKGTRKLPTRVIKEQICNLTKDKIVAVTEEFKEVFHTGNIRAPVPYLASCIFESCGKPLNKNNKKKNTSFKFNKKKRMLNDLME